MLKQVAGAKFGDGFEEGVTHGPIQNKMQFERVVSLVEDAKAAGGEVLCGGGRLEGSAAGSYFYAPTVVTNVKEGVRLVDEEQFGSVPMGHGNHPAAQQHPGCWQPAPQKHTRARARTHPRTPTCHTHTLART